MTRDSLPLVEASPSIKPRQVGRYLMLGEIASGGMASVHFGRMRGASGFSRTVAIKQMLPEFARNAEARAMIIDEARLSARVNHVNVVQTLDVVTEGNELFLILEYVHGETLHALLKLSREQGLRVPVPVVVSIVLGALHGVEAAHSATDDDGSALEIVHRDLSPQNIIVDTAGVPRVLDFGVAKARGRLQQTRTGEIKGKFAYMAPEQIHGETTPLSDVFSMGVVLWDGLTMNRLFRGANEAALLSAVLACQVPPPSGNASDISPELDRLCLRATASRPEERFPSARAMAEALERLPRATVSEVGTFVKTVGALRLAQRALAISALHDEEAIDIEEIPATLADPPSQRRAARSLGVALGLVGLAGMSVGAWRALEAARSAPRAVAMPVPVPDEPRPSLPAALLPPTPTPIAPPVPEGGLVEARAKETPSSAPVKAATAKRREATRKAGVREEQANAKCEPPWVIDAQGIKTYKRECFK